MKNEMETLFQIAEKRSIERIKEGKRFSWDETIVKEEEYTLIVNNKKRTEFFCTPTDLEELAAGYALIEKIIRQREDIKSIQIREENREIVMEISDRLKHQEKSQEENHGKQLAEAVSLSPESVFELWRKFDEACVHFRLTGGLHAVALCSEQEVLFIKEDVARHNALLKVLGKALLSDIPLEDKGLFFSGRVATQMVRILAKTQAKLLLCHGAATLGAVEEAAKSGMTLVGFIRNQYMNIYTGSDKIEGGTE